MTQSSLPVEEQPQIVTVQEVPRDFNSLAWSMADKIAQGSTAVIFAMFLVWWFSRKTIAEVIKRHNDLLDTLSQATRANANSQEKLNETLKVMGEEDTKTAITLGRMDSKLKLIRSLLLEVRSYQTGIPQNRLPLLEVFEDEDDSSLGG